MSAPIITMRERYLQRAVADFDAARIMLISKSYSDPIDVNAAAIAVVLASRLEAIEDAITNGLPTAGEGL